MAQPPRIPVLTICVDKKKKVLANADFFSKLQKALLQIQYWRVEAGVVMPDHMHFLAWPLSRDEEPTRFSAMLKRLAKAEPPEDCKWQRGVFDRLLRSDESAEEKWFYIRENPVRAGLVKRWEDWPYRIEPSQDKL